MADEVKPATLEPANDPDLLDIAAAVIASHHPGLNQAVIRYFWALDRPLSYWGSTKIASEETWWLSGGLEEEGAEIIIKINEALWRKLSPLGRQGMIDLRLAGARLKEGGKTEMSTSEGTRLLYEAAKPSLGLDPVVIARNPRLVEDIAELRSLHRAMTDPAQFMLDLAAPAEQREDDEEDEGETGGEGAAAAPDQQHVYYRPHTFGGSHGEERTVLRFSQADLRPSSLCGVYLLEGEHPGARKGSIAVDHSVLVYDTTDAAIRAYRTALEEEQAERLQEVRMEETARSEAPIRDQEELAAAEAELAGPAAGEGVVGEGEAELAGVVVMGSRRSARG